MEESLIGLGPLLSGPIPGPARARLSIVHHPVTAPPRSEALCAGGHRWMLPPHVGCGLIHARLGAGAVPPPSILPPRHSHSSLCSHHHLSARCRWPFPPHPVNVYASPSARARSQLKVPATEARLLSSLAASSSSWSSQSTIVPR
jgi:hypothetical protein